MAPLSLIPKLTNTLLSFSSHNTPPLPKRTFQNKFKFVPFGSSAPPPPTVTISCDGRVPDSTLELTHWTNNITPDSLYADTSTEIALNFASLRTNAAGAAGLIIKSEEEEEELFDGKFDDALILNNHYDTDGVLSAWTCLNPVKALEYRDLLIQGAEAGDFGEWSSDAGVKLDCAVLSLNDGGNEADAYERAFEVLPSLLDDLVSNDGMKFEYLWRDGWEDTLRSWDSILEGRAVVESGEGNVALLRERAGDRVSSFALHRALKEKGLAAKQERAVTRILRSSPRTDSKDENGSRWCYEYEKAGHGWVDRLVERKSVPPVDDAPELVEALNRHCSTVEGSDGGVWRKGGSSGLVAVCKTDDPVDVSPRDVMKLLVENDAGAAT